ncbi:MAG: hypothetical protein V1821_04555, partial [bacterium]
MFGFFEKPRSPEEKGGGGGGQKKLPPKKEEGLSVASEQKGFSTPAAIPRTSVEREKVEENRKQIEDEILYYLYHVPGSWEYPYSNGAGMAYSVAELSQKQSNKILKEILRGFQRTSPYDVGCLLAAINGSDTPEAWRLRCQIYDRQKSTANQEEISHQDIQRELVSRSLVGLNSLEAWDFRERLSESDLLRSLAGLDVWKAWEIRGRIYEKLGSGDSEVGENIALALLDSLIGCDSQEAWA